MRRRTLALLGLMAVAVPVSSRLRLEVAGTHAVGEVVEVERMDNATAYRPVIDIEVSPRRHAQLHGIAVSPAMYVVGEHVDVLYDPAAPEAGVIGSLLARWWLLATLAGLCLALALPEPAKLARYRAARWLTPHLLGIGLSSLLVVVLPSPRPIARACIGIFCASSVLVVLCVLRRARCPQCDGRTAIKNGIPLHPTCAHCRYRLASDPLPVAVVRARRSSG